MPSTPDLNATLIEWRTLAPGLAVLKVRPDGWTLPDYKPGQFAVLGLPASAPRIPGAQPEARPVEPDKLVRRSYSIASSPLVRDHLEFYISLVHNGGLTPRLFGLKVGDRLRLEPKITGSFTLDHVPDGVHLCLFSTGTGLAPYISMARTHARAHPWKTITVLHCIRFSSELGYREELEALDRDIPNFHYIGTLSRPHLEPTPWTGPTGYVQAHWKNGTLEKRWGEKPTPHNTRIFLCGNPTMIDQMVEVLTAEGYKEQHRTKEPNGQIHVERYW